MDDFLARESDILGDEFSAPTDTGGSFATATGADIDFDAAASAFPDISLDGSSDIPVPAAAVPAASSGSFSFDAFSPPPIQKTTEVKVTGDDEIEKFESEFPEIEVPSVSLPVLYATLNSVDTCSKAFFLLLRRRPPSVLLRRSRLGHNHRLSHQHLS